MGDEPEAVIQTTNQHFAPPPPENANAAYVLDFDQQTIFAHVVPEHDVTFLFGFKYREFCNGDFSNIDVFSIHEVLKDEGDDFARIHDLTKGEDVILEIWPFADLTYGADCQIYFDNDPLFSGRVDVVFRDNDLTPFDDDPNINTWGFKAQGDGVKAVLQAAWDGLNDDTYRTLICKIKYN